MRIGDILISQERDKQINLKEYTIEKDVEFYSKGELALMAKYVLMEDEDDEKDELYRWLAEFGIGSYWLNKAKTYSRVQRLVVAGALLAAEIDRIETSKIKN